MKRQLSEAAQVAKICRNYLKDLGISAKATSENYAGGNSVNIYMEDIGPKLYDKINSDLAKYKEGTFNGMEDIYEYSSNPENLPLTKYLFIRNEPSELMRKKIAIFIKEKYGIDENDDKECMANQNCWYSQFSWQVYANQYDQYNFWGYETND